MLRNRTSVKCAQGYCCIHAFTVWHKANCWYPEFSSHQLMSSTFPGVSKNPAPIKVHKRILLQYTHTCLDHCVYRTTGQSNAQNVFQTPCNSLVSRQVRVLSSRYTGHLSFDCACEAQQKPCGTCPQYGIKNAIASSRWLALRPNRRVYSVHTVQHHSLVQTYSKSWRNQETAGPGENVCLFLSTLRARLLVRTTFWPLYFWTNPCPTPLYTCVHTGHQPTNCLGSHVDYVTCWIYKVSHKSKQMLCHRTSFVEHSKHKVAL